MELVVRADVAALLLQHPVLMLRQRMLSRRQAQEHCKQLTRCVGTRCALEMFVCERERHVSI